MSCQKIFLKVLQNSQNDIFTGVSFLIKLETGNLKLSETASWYFLQKKVDIFFKKHLYWGLFFIKLKVSVCNFIKKTSTPVLSCEICQIFKSNYFEEHLW